jgi:hypothetical protein
VSPADAVVTPFEHRLARRSAPAVRGSMSARRFGGERLVEDRCHRRLGKDRGSPT